MTTDIEQFQFPVTGPVIYAIRHENGVVKVGYSSAPRARMQQHERASAQLGVQIDAVWVSDAHQNARENERHLIEFCESIAPRTTGRTTGEYFTGADFDEVVRFAAALPMSPTVRAEEESADRTECPACVEVDARPITAQSVLHLVAHGELRIVDRSGRDVSAVWAGSAVVSCRHSAPAPDPTLSPRELAESVIAEVSQFLAELDTTPIQEGQ